MASSDDSTRFTIHCYECGESVVSSLWDDHQREHERADRRELGQAPPRRTPGGKRDRLRQWEQSQRRRRPGEP